MALSRAALMASMTWVFRVSRFLPLLSLTSCTRISSLGTRWLAEASRSTLGPAAQAAVLPAAIRPATRRAACVRNVGVWAARPWAVRGSVGRV